MTDPALITAILFGAAGFIMVFSAMAILGRLLRGRAAAYDDKTAPYECGELPVGEAWTRFNPRFLLLAVVFVLFDIEIAFLFPWAVAYREALGSIGMLAFWDMLLFVVILLAGYVWFWRLGELRWILPGKEPSR